MGNTISKKKEILKSRYVLCDTEVDESLIFWLETHGEIFEYVYIRHDRDVWTEKDQAEDATHKAWTIKPAHYHVILDVKKKTTLSEFKKLVYSKATELLETPYPYFCIMMLHDMGKYGWTYQYTECAIERQPKYDIAEVKGSKKMLSALTKEYTQMKEDIEKGVFLPDRTSEKAYQEYDERYKFMCKVKKVFEDPDYCEKMEKRKLRAEIRKLKKECTEYLEQYGENGKESEAAKSVLEATLKLEKAIDEKGVKS